MKYCKLKKVLSIIIISLIIIGSVPFISANNVETTVTIYHTNDMHGCLNSLYNPEGKLLQIGVDVLKAIKDRDPDSILVDAGDATQGNIMASYSKGKKIIELMNAAGYDIACLGNHDFDYGFEEAKENIALAEFPFISANVVYEDNTPFLKNERNNGCNVIKTIKGKKIGIFSVDTTETGYKTNPKSINGLIFKDEIETSKEQVNELKNQGVDVIIGMMHVGNSGSSKVTSDQIAKAVSGIDIIIDAHSHQEYTKKIGNTIIQQTGTLSKKLGKIDIKFNKDGSFLVEPKLIKAGELIDPTNSDAMQYVPDAKVKSLCDSVLSEISDISETVVGKSEVALYGGSYEKTSIGRLTDTNFGCLIADIFIDRAKSMLKESGNNLDTPVVSMQNGGGVRDSLNAGFVNMEDVLRVFPFSNNISLKWVTPKNIYEILENGVKSSKIENGVLAISDGAFPNVGGMRFEYDINETPLQFDKLGKEIINKGSRIKKVILLNEDGTDKQVLDRNDNETQIVFVSNNFEMSGGDQYVMLKDLPYVTDDGPIISEVLSSWLKNNKFIVDYPANMSRVKIINEENIFTSYDVKIKTKENSMPLANTTLQVMVDQNEWQNVNTNANGEIILNGLEFGPHNIRVKHNDFYTDVYTNNCLGIEDASAFLESRSPKNIKSVMNIIKQISSPVSKDDYDIVKFARSSYNGLTDTEKSAIDNYQKLLDAEKTLKHLGLDIELYDQVDYTAYYIVGSSVLVLVLAAVIIIYYKKKRQKNSMAA